MFEAWSEAMGGICQVSGVPGFLENAREFYAASDAEGQQWRLFVSAWWEKHNYRKVGVKELWDIAVEHDLLDLGNGGDRSQRTRLGAKLAQARDRQYGDFRIVAAGVQHQAQMYQLVTADNCQSPVADAAEGNLKTGSPQGSPHELFE